MVSGGNDDTLVFKVTGQGGLVTNLSSRFKGSTLALIRAPIIIGNDEAFVEDAELVTGTETIPSLNAHWVLDVELKVLPALSVSVAELEWVDSNVGLRVDGHVLGASGVTAKVGGTVFGVLGSRSTQGKGLDEDGEEGDEGGGGEQHLK